MHYYRLNQVPRTALLATLLCCFGPISSIFAQPQPSSHDELSQELQTLVESWNDSQPTAEKLKIVTRLTELEPRIETWPLKEHRDQFRGRLFETLGDCYFELDGGMHSERLEGAIASYKTATNAYTASDFPVQWARLQSKLGRLLIERRVGSRSDNLELAVTALRNATSAKLQTAAPTDWARAQYYLGNALSDRIDGNRTENLELAIQAYQASETIWTAETHPNDWAKAKINLAVAYRNRIEGPRAENLSKAIKHYQDSLRVFTHEAFPQFWGWAQIDLAETYLTKPLPAESGNVEHAIECYNAALTVFSKTLFPRDWARTNRGLGQAYGLRKSSEPLTDIERALQFLRATLEVYSREQSQDFAAVHQQLGDLYLRRLQGSQSENIGLAIRAFDSALSVYEPNSLPWAEAQFERGQSFFQRTQTDRAESLEYAIRAFQAALSVWKKDKQPNDWVKAQNALGIAFRYRIQGNKADNLEQAIEAYELALSEIRPGTIEWGATQNNLGIAYQQRIRGDRSDNLELAIKRIEAALTVLTYDATPDDWANAKSNLGNVYFLRTRGDRVSNLSVAAANYGDALKVFKETNHPLEWAGVMTNLGSAAFGAPTGAGRDVEAALRAFKAALRVYTHDAYPEQWAAMQDRIGNALFRRRVGNRSDNEAAAIEAFQNALSIRTLGSFPREWAQTQANLADVLSSRSKDTERAIAAYKAALTVFTVEIFPREHLSTALDLGELYAKRGEWALARQNYDEARRAFFLLFGEGLDEIDARDLIDKIGALFSEMAYAVSALGDQRDAFNILNEGKAQQMAVALRQQALQLPPEKRERYDSVRRELRESTMTLEKSKGGEGIEVQQHIIALRHDLVELMPEWIRPGHGAEDAISLASRFVPEGGAIVAPIVTDLGCKIIIVAKIAAKSVVSTIALPNLTTGRVDELLRGAGKSGNGGWLAAYKIQYLPPAQLRSRIGEWRDAIEGIGSVIWNLFAGRVDVELRRLGLVSGGRLIWLPTGGLGLLPLDLAQNPENGSYFVDSYEISYAANLQALSLAFDLIHGDLHPSLIVVSNPTGNIPELNLPFAEMEGALVRSHFRNTPVAQLDYSDASPGAVLAAAKAKTYWHFSSHGFFDWDDARRAGLRMKDDAPLTVSDLLASEEIQKPRLVVLSACETGLYDTRRRPDEFIGLPTAFEQLGAAGVLSALWQVDDLATTFLMAKFYQLHIDRNESPPNALRQAQLWLRTASKAQLLEFGRSAAEAAKLDPTKLANLESSVKSRYRSGTRGSFWNMLGQLSKRVQQRLQSHPFSHPYYWAGFVHTGL
jgi:CHAT domain-containing protein/tetratricopeptide (TPR) repeat protein